MYAQDSQYVQRLRKMEGGVLLRLPRATGSKGRQDEYL